MVGFGVTMACGVDFELLFGSVDRVETKIEESAAAGVTRGVCDTGTTGPVGVIGITVSPSEVIFVAFVVGVNDADDSAGAEAEEDDKAAAVA